MVSTPPHPTGPSARLAASYFPCNPLPTGTFTQEDSPCPLPPTISTPCTTASSPAVSVVVPKASSLTTTRYGATRNSTLRRTQVSSSRVPHFLASSKPRF